MKKNEKTLEELVAEEHLTQRKPAN
ncbi:MAG: hypothetical protein PWQ59_462, partial [Thermoanaerobacterium sp.]|nr:hypothetical protein [Thermoanaerobacterium sp.]